MKAVPSIPADMVFVVGDTLVVKNEDSVSHQLGPIWVPPGASASLNLNQTNNYSYTCSFEPSRYLGLDVRPRVTWATRIVAVLLAGIPTGAMIAVYSKGRISVTRFSGSHSRRFWRLGIRCGRVRSHRHWWYGRFGIRQRLLRHRRLWRLPILRRPESCRLLRRLRRSHREPVRGPV